MKNIETIKKEDMNLSDKIYIQGSNSRSSHKRVVSFRPFIKNSKKIRKFAPDR